MIRLIQIELSKLYHYKAARIFSIIYFALLLIITFGLTQDISLFGGAITLNLVEQGAYDYPVIWHFITFVAAILKLFVAIILITSVTQEYSNRTLKQNLIDGLSKWEFILSKVLVFSLFALVSTLFLVISGFVFGEAGEKALSPFLEMEFILYYFIKLIAFFSFCMLLSFLLRRSAFALLGFFLWYIFEAILAGLEIFLRTRFDAEKVIDIGPSLFANYLPLTAMSNLIKAPFTRLNAAEMFTRSGMIKYDYLTEPSYVVASILYAGLFIWLSFRLLKSRDL